MPFCPQASRQPLATTVWFLFLECRKSGILQHVDFCVSFLSLRILLLTYDHFYYVECRASLDVYSIWSLKRLMRFHLSLQYWGSLSNGGCGTLLGFQGSVGISGVCAPYDASLSCLPHVWIGRMIPKITFTCLPLYILKKKKVLALFC